jgi:hypothetical protein
MLSEYTRERIMKYDIVNNLDANNHKSLVESLLENCDEFILISPFLSSNFNNFSFQKYRNQLKRITLITTLKPKTSDQLNKTSFFDELFLFGHTNNIKIDILIDNSLHAKVYLFKKGSKHNTGIITSANFTKNGLSINNEWGVSITDSVILESIENRILSKVIFKKITRSDVNLFKKKIENIPAKKSENENDVNLLSNISLKPNPLNLDSKTTYWLKPIGTSENPVPWAQPFNKLEQYLHFSDKNPTGVKIGNILIAYAVVHKNILSVYRVKSNVFIDKKNTRFPYYVIGENITPFYGGKWFEYNITISNQRDEVLSRKRFNITPSGKNSYGSFMYGADKLKITKDFADHLIGKIIKEDKQIEASLNN